MSAAGSAAEAGYLAGLSARPGFLNPADGERIAESYNELVAKLVALINSLNSQP